MSERPERYEEALDDWLLGEGGQERMERDVLLLLAGAATAGAVAAKAMARRAPTRVERVTWSAVSAVAGGAAGAAAIAAAGPSSSVAGSSNRSA